MSWIETHSGAQFKYNEPEESWILIEDIAHALANQCRYNGHCSRFYSVAEHSVLVSQVLPDELKLYGLLHDAAEAYLGDVAKPQKDLPWMAEYKAYEHRVMAHIFNTLVGEVPDVEQRKAIHEADMDVLTREAIELMVSEGSGWSATRDRVPADVKIVGWVPDVAEQWFTHKWIEYTEGGLDEDSLILATDKEVNPK